MSVTEYITSAGDRWDNISQGAYGDPTKLKPIMDANPDVAIEASFEAGVRLLVPIIEDDLAVTNKDLLPPWKRGTTSGEQSAVDGIGSLKNPVSPSASGSYDGSFD